MKIIVASFQCESNSKAKLHPTKEDFEYFKGEEIFKKLVDVKNFVSQEVGTMDVKDVPLKAYDESGNVIDVEIVPSTIDAKVTIASPSKEAPIKVIPTGNVAFGKAISSIETSETKVTVYGNADVLNSLNYIPVEIDVNDLKENHQYKIQLMLLSHHQIFHHIYSNYY